MLRIGIVAGEASGDTLGANLIRDLRECYPEIQCEGIAGDAMRAVGCRSLYPIEKLSVMGFTEVLGSFADLYLMRRKLIDYFLANPPDLFIGVDAPDFNLELEYQLKKKGIPTVHYVSPSVWAWRRYRLGKIKKSVDLMLTLFPFETDFYTENGVSAEFVGHPLATIIKMKPDSWGARERLGIAPEKVTIGIMPGSRNSELSKLWPPFLETADMCWKGNKQLQFISSLLNENKVEQCSQVKEEHGYSELPLNLFVNRAHDVLEASDVLLLASGTITLEAMLFKKPMVVAYKLNQLSYWLVRYLSYIDHAALPNILAGRELVPECLQSECEPDIMSRELENWLHADDEVNSLQKIFQDIHQSLLVQEGRSAANVVSHFLHERVGS